MRRVLMGAALLTGLAGASSARADCSTEVQLAVQAQGKQRFLRKETQLVSEEGPVNMTIEYQIPDRMRQIVSLVADPKPVETIVVGDKAWSNAGQGWKEVAEPETQQLIQFMIKSSSQIYQDVGKFECLGAETVDGKQLRAYRGLDEAPNVPGKDPPQTQKNEAVRMIYLDAETGLPARSIFARPAMLDKPIFKEVYTYPAELKIEPPANVKK
ncbi:MAG TPA: hypothetical protein VJ045_03865 [Hyphomicrobiaceae bacterium]|nr:hypothetical protein [Hyphomicrobiaceae bacterium]